MFVIDGRIFGLELKTEVGTLSKVQFAFGEDLARAGGEYLFAFGLEQAISVLIDIKAFRPNIHINVKGLM